MDILQPPNIMISRQDDLIEGSSKLLMFWEKLRLEPYSAKKHINYFVVYPKNDSIEGSVSHFFKGLSTIYETCQLGVHHPGSIGPYRKGLVPVPLLRKCSLLLVLLSFIRTNPPPFSTIGRRIL